jgi:ribosomal protein L28
LPNLQKIRIQWQGHVQMARVCTQCLRTGKVSKALRGLSKAKAASATTS